MTYKIKDVLLEVTNSIKEFDDIIFGRFSQFEKQLNISTENYLKINFNSIEINIKNEKKIINSRIIKTDIYTIINNVISKIINDEKNIYMHSVVVSNEQNGILLIGNFGSGKSVLANEFSKRGYVINSTDQTWLKIGENGNLLQVLGSRLYFEKNKIKFIDKSDSQSQIILNKILRIVGLCENGNTYVEESVNEYHKVKQISDYCNWSNSTPLFTKDVELYNIKEFTKDFLLQIKSVSLFNIRGDKTNIVSKVEQGEF